MSKKKKVISALEFGEYINRYNSQLENALQLKNFSHSSTFSDNVNSACAVINTIPTETDDYDENWIDIREIMDNDEFEGPKAIFLFTDKKAYTKFTVMPYTKIICSDGFIYTNNSSSNKDNVEHTWDLSKDVQYPNRTYKMRWMLVYDLLPEGVTVLYSSFYRLNYVINNVEISYNRPLAMIYKNLISTSSSDVTFKGIIEYLKFDSCDIECINYDFMTQGDTHLTIVRTFVSINSTINSIAIRNGYFIRSALSYPMIQKFGYNGANKYCVGIYEKGLNLIVTNSNSTTNSDTSFANVPCDHLTYNSEVSISPKPMQAIYLVYNFSNKAAFPSGSVMGARYIKCNYTAEEPSDGTIPNSHTIGDSNLIEFLTTFTINTNYLSFATNSSSSNDCIASLTNLVAIAEKLKDKTSETAATLKIPGTKNQLRYVYVKNIDDHLTMVDSLTEDAVTLLEYITNKNWTIS